MKRLKSFRELLRDEENKGVPLLHDIVVLADTGKAALYEGRKWISGRFDRNIGIDQPTYGAGQPHAHIYGRKGREVVLVVNLDGTGSHGTKGRLPDADADALRAQGFAISLDNIVEWVELPDQPIFLQD